MNLIDLKSHAIGVIFVFVVSIFTSVAGYPREASGDNSRRLKRLAGDFGIEVVTTHPQFPIRTPHGMIDGKVADREDLEHYTELFVSEFSLYPPTLIKKQNSSE